MKARIWVRQSHEALAMKRRGTYTSSAKENCAQHISQPLTLKVLVPLLANLVVKQRLVCVSRPGSGSGQGKYRIQSGPRQHRALAREVGPPCHMHVLTMEDSWRSKGFVCLVRFVGTYVRMYESGRLLAGQG